jgi:hypothetical protein
VLDLPPSTTSICPLMKLASGDARENTGPARSSGCSSRLIARNSCCPSIKDQRQQGTHPQECSTQVDRNDLLPLLRVHFLERNDGVVAGAIDQDIHSATLDTDRFRKATRVVRFGNVSFNSDELVLGVPCFQQGLRRPNGCRSRRPCLRWQGNGQQSLSQCPCPSSHDHDATLLHAFPLGFIFQTAWKKIANCLLRIPGRMPGSVRRVCPHAAFDIACHFKRVSLAKSSYRRGLCPSNFVNV